MDETVFGESAGAISIGSFLVADNGKAVEKLNLFRGAIMQSGAPSGSVHLNREYLVLAKIRVLAAMPHPNPRTLIQHISY